MNCVHGSFWLLMVNLATAVACSTCESAQVGQTEVFGVVTDNSGQSLGGVMIDVVTLRHRPRDHVLVGSTIITSIGQTSSDSDGRFRLLVQRSSDDSEIALEVIAYSAGYAVYYKFLDIKEAKHDLAIRLKSQQPLHGRLVGPNGDPVGEAILRITNIKVDNVDSEGFYAFTRYNQMLGSVN